MRRTLLLLLILAPLSALGWGVYQRLAEDEQAGDRASSDPVPVPVEVAPVERGAITLRRTFSGALEAAAEFIAAPKVGGRLDRLHVDLGDAVERGQVVASLEDEEFRQAILQTEADLAVAQARFSEAKSALVIAERALQRALTLLDEGVSSESQMDAERAAELSARSYVEVTEANVARAEAEVETARIRLGYTQVTASWSGGQDRRVVAERFVDEGATVSANSALLSIVELDPIVGVVYVPERDYAYLGVGQIASLQTDAYPGRDFEGRVARIAPVFRRSTRQARIELLVANEEERLKPGMFVRATLELERMPDATIVPFEALTERDGRAGIFVLDPTGEAVAWRPVEAGIREGDRVEVRGAGLSGTVVTLGQELCDDGSRIAVANPVQTPDAIDGADRPSGAPRDGR